MKNIARLMLIVIMLVLLAACGKKSNVLYVFNWSDYINPDLVKQFEEAYDCEVRESYFESNENMLTKIESSRQAYDIIVPSGDHVTILAQKELLEPLDKSKLTNYGNLDPQLLLKAQSFDPENKFSVPYFWGITGLMYNKKHVPQSVIEQKSWSILGDAYFSGKQKVTMLEDAREVIGAALIFAGHDLNDASEAALADAEKILDIWDKNITQYDSESYKNEVADGTSWLAQAYNGDALQQMAQNSDLDFFLPVEGSSLWMDNMVILKSSQNKELAYKFIDFLLEAENAKLNAEYTQYPTPNKAAYDHLDETQKMNELIYPRPEYLEKCTMIQFLGEKIKGVDALFEKIRLN